MVNSQVVREIERAFKLDRYRDNIPNAIPVLEVGLKKTKELQSVVGTRITSGNGNVITTPTVGDFYVKAVLLGCSKDATCDVATGAIRLDTTVGGKGTSLMTIPVLTLTAESNACSLSFENPIRVDKGVNIELAGATYTVGLMSRTTVIHYYIDEVI